jgi:hypothetical protein
MTAASAGIDEKPATLQDRARQLIERTTGEQLLPFHVEDDEVLTTVASALIRSRDR